MKLSKATSLRTLWGLWSSFCRSPIGSTFTSCSHNWSTISNFARFKLPLVCYKVSFLSASWCFKSTASSLGGLKLAWTNSWLALSAAPLFRKQFTDSCATGPRGAPADICTFGAKSSSIENKRFKSTAKEALLLRIFSLTHRSSMIVYKRMPIWQSTSRLKLRTCSATTATSNSSPMKSHHMPTIPTSQRMLTITLVLWMTKMVQKMQGANMSKSLPDSTMSKVNPAL